MGLPQYLTQNPGLKVSMRSRITFVKLWFINVKNSIKTVSVLSARNQESVVDLGDRTDTFIFP